MLGRGSPGDDRVNGFQEGTLVYERVDGGWQTVVFWLVTLRQCCAQWQSDWVQVQIVICECVNYFVSRDSNVYDRVNG